MKQTIQICTSEKARSPLPIWIGQLYVCLLVNFARDPGRVKTMGTRLCSSQFAKQHLGHVIKGSFVVKQILGNCSWKFDDFFRISNINKIKIWTGHEESLRVRLYLNVKILQIIDASLSKLAFWFFLSLISQLENLSWTGIPIICRLSPIFGVDFVSKIFRSNCKINVRRLGQFCWLNLCLQIFSSFFLDHTHEWSYDTKLHWFGLSLKVLNETVQNWKHSASKFIVFLMNRLL